MTRGTLANRFGLIAVISLGLFATTAVFAGTGPQQVVVTNTPAQPVPMVGVTKDSDAPARKSFDWDGYISAPSFVRSDLTVTTVPAGQRLVIEQVSGWCGGMLGIISLSESQSGASHYQFLDGKFTSGANSPASASVRFYVDPGAVLSFQIDSTSNTQHDCYLTLSGYYVSLP